MKSHKSTLKRLKKTKTGKILRRDTAQDHFNARDNGKQTRKKRRIFKVAKQDHKKINKLLGS